jgi:hypothetical protein
VKRILLLHLDGKLPNVALMRVAAHHRALGDEVVLRRAPTVAAVAPELGDHFDRVYASAIFERTRPVAERLLAERPDALVGGTGWDLRRSLEDIGIVTKAQDYAVYPRFQPSIGFTQRGCRLRCAFCVVPKTEGAAREEQSIADLWRGDPHPRQILLLDNDFFGVPTWRTRVDELRAGGFRVCFSQGINARMISDEATLFRGLDRLAAAGVKPDHVMVYCLIGYWPGETHADRDYRRQRLRAWGARPYPMPFTRTPELLGFARWCIGAYDKAIPWEEWTRAQYEPRGLGDRTGAQLALPWGPPVGDGSSTA